MAHGFIKSAWTKVYGTCHCWQKLCHCSVVLPRDGNAGGDNRKKLHPVLIGTHRCEGDVDHTAHTSAVARWQKDGRGSASEVAARAVCLCVRVARRHAGLFMHVARRHAGLSRHVARRHAGL